MKLFYVFLVSALAITPAALRAQTLNLPASVTEALTIAPPVVTEQAAIPAVAVATQPAQQTSDKTEQNSSKITAKSNVIPTSSAAIGSSLDANDLDSLPMEGRNALSIVGTR